MSSILLVDYHLAFREELGERLREVGYMVSHASSAPQALDALARRIPKVVVVDVDMPTISGMELIRHVRSRGHLLRLPIIILSYNTDQRMVLEAARLKVGAFLSKRDYNFAGLVLRLVEATGEPPPAEIMFPVLGKEASRALERKASQPGRESAADQDLPRIPLQKFLQSVSSKAFKPEAARILGKCAFPEVSLDEIEFCIRDSPSLAAQILRSANSAAFNPNGRKVHKLSEAVTRLGVNHVREVVSNSVIETHFLSEIQEESGWRAWQNGLACGRIMEVLRKSESATTAGTDYLLGISTSLIPLVVCQTLGRDLQRVKASLEHRRLLKDDLLEEIFDAPSEEIHRGIFEKVGLPANLVDILVAAVGSFLGRGKDLTDPTIRALNNAYRFANAMGFPLSPYALIQPLTANEHRLLPSISSLKERWTGIRDEVLLRSFEIAQDAKVVRGIISNPFFTRREDLKIELRAGPEFSEFGPIRMFLSAIAQLVEPGSTDTPPDALVVVGATPEARSLKGDSHLPTLHLHPPSELQPLVEKPKTDSSLAYPCSLHELCRSAHALQVD